MKIAVVTHNVFLGEGQALVNYHMVMSALENGHEITIYGDRVCESLLEKPNIKFVSCRSRLRTPMFLRVREFATRANAVLKKDRKKFDVVVGTGYSLGLPHDINVCHFVHNAWQEIKRRITDSRGLMHRINQSIYTKVNCRWEKRAYQLASDVIAVSTMVKRELISLGLPDEKIQVINNGVDNVLYSPKTVTRSSVGLPEDVPLALFVGDIRTPRKNLQTVLEAMEQLHDVHLVIAGRIDSSPFPAYVKEKGLHERVHFLGFRSDIHLLMCAVDCVVYPSLYEPFGLVVAEAMSCGTPVVTSRSVGASDLLGNAGVVIEDPTNALELGHGIRKAVSDASWRQQAYREGPLLAEQCNWKIVKEQYVQAFENVGKRHS